MALVTKDCVFLHYPKCGGTSLKVAAYTAGLVSDENWHAYCEWRSHEGYSFYRKEFPKHTIYGFIRPPLEVYFSEYNYKRSVDPTVIWKGLRQRGCEEARSLAFEPYVVWGLTSNHGCVHKNENHWLVLQQGMEKFFRDAYILTIEEAFALLGIPPRRENQTKYTRVMPQINCKHRVYLSDLEFYNQRQPITFARVAK